jgi:hypothetical protein
LCFVTHTHAHTQRRQARPFPGEREKQPTTKLEKKSEKYMCEEREKKMTVLYVSEYVQEQEKEKAENTNKKEMEKRKKKKKTKKETRED